MTLNHVLAVDAYYIGALLGDSGLAQSYENFAPADDVPTLTERQRTSDERLITFCDRLDATGCDAEVEMDRGNGKIQRDLAGHVLSHLFMHQTHHRGSGHTLAGSRIVSSGALLRRLDGRVRPRP